MKSIYKNPFFAENYRKSDMAVMLLERHKVDVLADQNEDMLVAIIYEQVGYSSIRSAKRGYERAKKRVIENERQRIKAEMESRQINQDGQRRSAVKQRGGKQTLASQIKQILEVEIPKETPLLNIVDIIEERVAARYASQGKAVNHNRDRLVSRNELVRLLPYYQLENGIPVMTETEIRGLTRKRKYQKKSY